MKRMHMLAMGAVISIFAGCAVDGEEIAGTDQAALKSCGLDCPDPGGGDPIDPPPPPPDPTSTSTYTPPPPPPPPTPISGLPQGLTGGLSYINHTCSIHWDGVLTLAGSIGNFFLSCVFAENPTCIPSGIATVKAIVNADVYGCSDPTIALNGYVGGTRTLTLSGDKKTFTVAGEPGWGVGSDGDRGNNSGFGFYHQELAVAGGGITDGSKSTLFALPPGTVCGFHHTQNDKANASIGMGTCMGFDPALGVCPSGWRARSHFDMSSGDGSVDCGNPANLNSPHCGNYVWCEYLDQNNFCPNGSACELNAINKGYAVGVASSTYASGADYYGQYCPSGSFRSGSYDDGMSSGQGVSSCTH